MSKMKEYQDTLTAATAKAAQQMANNNFADHGLNQNGTPLQTYQNQLNESIRVVQVIDNSPRKPKLGEGAVKSMLMKGWDEAGHMTRAFHDPDTVPVAPSYLESNTPSPLQAMQQELHQPAMEQQQEMER